MTYCKSKTTCTLQLLEVSSTVGIPLFFHHCECNNIDTPASLCKVLATPPSYVLQPCHDQLTFTVFLLLLMRCSWTNSRQAAASYTKPSSWHRSPNSMCHSCDALESLQKVWNDCWKNGKQGLSEWSKILSISSLVISALVSRISIFSLFCLGSPVIFSTEFTNLIFLKLLLFQPFF